MLAVGVGWRWLCLVCVLLVVVVGKWLRYGCCCGCMLLVEFAGVVVG